MRLSSAGFNPQPHEGNSLIVFLFPHGVFRNGDFN